MKKAHSIAPDVKEQILKRIKEEGIPVALAAKDHGIHESTIYNWLGAGAQGAPSWAEFAKLKRENKTLLELVGEITPSCPNPKKRVNEKHRRRQNILSKRTRCLCLNVLLQKETS